MAEVKLPELFFGAPEMAWATLPTASTVTGMTVRVTDVGVGGSFWTSNGTKWYPTATEVLLANDQTTLAITGTASEVQTFTLTIPAGMMGANGVLEIVSFFTYTNSANNKTLRVRFGGTSGTVFSTVTTTTSENNTKYLWIRNANSTSSQKGPSAGFANGFGTGTSAGITSAVNTASAVDVVVSAQLSLSTETVTYIGCRISYRE